MLSRCQSSIGRLNWPQLYLHARCVVCVVCVNASGGFTAMPPCSRSALHAVHLTMSLLQHSPRGQDCISTRSNSQAMHSTPAASAFTHSQAMGVGSVTSELIRLSRTHGSEQIDFERACSMWPASRSSGARSGTVESGSVGRACTGRQSQLHSLYHHVIRRWGRLGSAHQSPTKARRRRTRTPRALRSFCRAADNRLVHSDGTGDEAYS